MMGFGFDKIEMVEVVSIDPPVADFNAIHLDRAVPA